MSDIKITIESAGSKRLIERINRAANFLGTAEMRRILNSHSEKVVKQFKANIDKMTPGSVPDLKKATKDRKLKKYGRVYPILRATNKMYNSMKGAAAHLRSGWAIQVRFAGDRGKVAAAHQDGDGVPRRDFTKIPASLRHELWDRIHDALLGA